MERLASQPLAKEDSAWLWGYSASPASAAHILRMMVDGVFLI